MNMEHHETYSIIRDGVKIKLGMSRIYGNLKKAQFLLDGMVMNSMEPFMPKQTGSFINVTRAASAAVQGSGKVYAAYGVQGRYLYEGKTMVDEETGSPWARAGAKKVLVSEYSGKTNAKPFLDFSKTANTQAQAHWFEAAKAVDCEKWIKRTKEAMR